MTYPKEPRVGTLKEVMNYFGSTSSKMFSEEWRALTFEEKNYFKEAVGEVLAEESLQS